MYGGHSNGEYDGWRRKHGLPTQPVKRIGHAELLAIYEANYWDAADCAKEGAGLDLCLFDAAVNSGVQRGLNWLRPGSPSIDEYCDHGA